jgi:hypothetical protein
MMKSFLFGSKFFDFIDFKNEPNWKYDDNNTKNHQQMAWQSNELYYESFCLVWSTNCWEGWNLTEKEDVVE